VFAHFMSALYSDGPLYLIDGGEVHRTFLHIKDANTGFKVILDNPARARNQVFNLGNPENNVTIRKFANLMIEIYEELTGRICKCEQINVSGEEFYGEGYEDADRLPPSVSKLRSLGWEPKHDLRATLRDTVLYYLSNPQEFDVTNSETS
jgi:UDP-apiose/xylose synthase